MSTQQRPESHSAANNGDLLLKSTENLDNNEQNMIRPTKIDETIMAKFDDVVSEYQIDNNRVDSGPNTPTDADRMLKFLCLIGRLKLLPRRGWTIENRNIANPESIAGHMYRMAIMSMLFENGDDDPSSPNMNNVFNGDNSTIPSQSISNGDIDNVNAPKFEPTNLNINKMIQMSLIHDMAECIVGDVTPNDPITADDKHEKEFDSIQKLVSLLPEKASKRLFDLYKEYECHQSKEALLVKELDRFDLCLQAHQYEQQEYWNHEHLVKFDRFFHIAQKHIKHPMLKSMVDKLIEQRRKFWEIILQDKTITISHTID